MHGVDESNHEEPAGVIRMKSWRENDDLAQAQLLDGDICVSIFSDLISSVSILFSWTVENLGMLEPLLEGDRKAAHRC